MAGHTGKLWIMDVNEALRAALAQNEELRAKLELLLKKNDAVEHAPASQLRRSPRRKKKTTTPPVTVTPPPKHTPQNSTTKTRSRQRGSPDQVQMRKAFGAQLRRFDKDLLHNKWQTPTGEFVLLLQFVNQFAVAFLLLGKWLRSPTQQMANPNR